MDITPSPASAKPSHAENFKHMLDVVHAQFPKFKHEKHSPIVNVNEVADERLTTGQKVADAVAATVGSWPFIIVQSLILAAWIVLNSLAWINHWDPYPFILLNLALSFQAAYAAPFVMMSQNRQAAKDRLTAENDYFTDCKGEEEVRHIMEHLDHQDALILQIVQRLEEQNKRLQDIDTLNLQIAQRLEAQHERLEAQRQEILERLSTLQPDQVQQAIADALDQAEEDQGDL